MLKNPAKTVAEITTFQFTSDKTAAVPTVATKVWAMVLIARIIAAFIHIFVFLHIKLISNLIFYYIYIRKKTYMVQKKKCKSVKKEIGNANASPISVYLLFL